MSGLDYRIDSSALVCDEESRISLLTIDWDVQSSVLLVYTAQTRVISCLVSEPIERLVPSHVGDNTVPTKASFPYTFAL